MDLVITMLSIITICSVVLMVHYFSLANYSVMAIYLGATILNCGVIAGIINA